MNAVETTKKPRPQDTQFWYLLTGAALLALIDTGIFERTFVLARLVGATLGFFALPAIIMYFARSVPAGWIALVILYGLVSLGRLQELGVIE
jgi:hypothetical protein